MNTNGKKKKKVQPNIYKNPKTGYTYEVDADGYEWVIISTILTDTRHSDDIRKGPNKLVQILLAQNKI